MQAIYNIDNFSFQYPLQHKAIFIRGSFQINQGDVILVQGNSGSGKSSLLLALKGIIPRLINGKLSGNILYDGLDITNLNDNQLQNIGYVGQNPDSQLICETVAQELAFGLENMHLDPKLIRKKIKDFSIKFGIDHLLSHKVVNLSGGEKQKVNLLAILLMDPQVLLLDEPTAFLDPQSAYQVMSIIKEFSLNKTIIIIEHNIQYLKNIINRLITINDSGQIVENSIENTNFIPDLPFLPCKINSSFDQISKQKDILSITNLNFAYNNQKTLLDGLILNLKPGVITGIIGSNGSGKSSLLKLISKILPSSKTIFYNGLDINTIKDKIYYQQIALLWQNPENHFLYDSVGKELDFDMDTLKLFSLHDHIKQNPFCLSEGQKRRLALAIAFKKEVGIFLLDEPTFGQDQANKAILANIISDLTTQGKCFIIVSHDINFLDALTHQIYCLDSGKLQLRDNL